jgi:hypothetical protein
MHRKILNTLELKLKNFIKEGRYNYIKMTDINNFLIKINILKC